MASQSLSLAAKSNTSTFTPELHRIPSFAPNRRRRLFLPTTPHKEEEKKGETVKTEQKILATKSEMSHCLLLRDPISRRVLGLLTGKK